MTAPHAGALRYILANPEDDAPRLVYADWLEEHGDGARARSSGSAGIGRD
jgi:uncharacterized protein (TIGR02996 family)